MGDYHVFAGHTDLGSIFEGMHGYQGQYHTIDGAKAATEQRTGGVFAWNWAHIAVLRDGRLCWAWRGQRRGSRVMEWQAVRHG